MPHRNAPLTETGRLRLARCVVEDGWPVRRAAERFQVSPTTAARWARSGTGSSARPGWLTGPPARITARRGCVDGSSGESSRSASASGWARPAAVPVRRYERDRPGELVHVDVKKLGNIPDGGGHRVAGRQRGKRNKQLTSPGRTPAIGYGYLHTALDDHSRLACTEILTDERADTAAAFLHRAHAWYAAGITIERVISDNGNCYRSRQWTAACGQLAITAKRTRPYRPQTNGKVERFHRTLADEWAYARPYRTETERRAALPGWLRNYNNHRGHTALGGNPPASRVTNLSGQNI